MRIDCVAEPEPLVEANRIVEPAVGLEEHRPEALFRRPGLAGTAEQLADAAALVRGGDGHLGELAAPVSDTDHRDGADDSRTIQREEDHAAIFNDRALRIVEHLAVRRLDLEKPLDPFEVEPAEVARRNRP